MIELEDTLADARRLLGTVSADPGMAEGAILHLENAGAQVGKLQVTCCSENRMPLYAKMLAVLTASQIRLDTALGHGH